MKNKKGFTLIELLAILIVLSIISIITVPIILNTLDNSKKGTAMDSAYGYVEAVNRLYYSNSMDGGDDIDDGIYSVSELKTMGVSVSGREPSEGWVELEESEVVSFSIKIGDYVITKYKNSEIVCEKGKSVSETEEERIARIAAEQQAAFEAEISAKVDTYVKAALSANSSLTYETSKTVSKMSSVTTNQADSGWIHFNKVNNSVVVVDYSLTYGSITANYSSLTDGNYVSTFGEARNKPVIIALGSDVCLTDTDCFKVIEINGETATLLANNNINPSTGMQGENGQNYSVVFSETNYWNISGQTYPVDIYDSTKDKEPGNNDYSVAYYVNQYVENLQNRGINVTSGRILTKSEVESGGIAYSYRAIGVNYWLGSARSSTHVYYWTSRILINYNNYTNSCDSGVRPVIYIGISDI